MRISEDHIKLILGLKVKQRRSDLGLTLKDLKVKSGLSMSYINEIEKGKKYPKPEKLSRLATALDTSFEDLVSLKLEKNLAPVGALLDANIIKDLPLQLFGINSAKLVTLLSEAPTKVNAFVSTLLEIGRNHELRQEHFFHTALRSYQELHLNYFSEIERGVRTFRKEKGLPQVGISERELKELLSNQYQYQFAELDIATHPELVGIRSIFIPEKGNLLLINPNLSKAQRNFLLAREIGFNHLELTDRPLTFSYFKAASFDELLNNFKASYFSIALLLDEKLLVDDLKSFFANTAFDAGFISDLLVKYDASPEMLFHRFSNLLPQHFGIKSLFFLRFNNMEESDRYTLSKELHLSQKHEPHGNRLQEHYCRRWVTISVLQALKKRTAKKTTAALPVLNAQISAYIGSDDRYLCFAIARAMSPTPKLNGSVTLGLLINNNLKKKVAFLSDEKIAEKRVSSTCERCTATDCKERQAPPFVVQRNEREGRIDDAIQKVRTAQ